MATAIRPAVFQASRTDFTENEHFAPQKSPQTFCNLASPITWKSDPDVYTHTHTRVSGNEIKKIANNSNRNCPGHIPSFPLIRSLYGAEGERGGRKEERNHSTTFRIDASSRSGLSDRFSFRGLVSGCYLQPPPLLYTVLRKRPTLRKNSFGSNKQARSFLLQIGNKRSSCGTTSFEHRFC